MSSLADRIKAAKDIESELIEVPQWGVTIEVRSMTGMERARMLQRINTESGDMDFAKLYPEVLVACSFDPDSGEKVFTFDDIEWLNTKSSGAIEKVARAGMRLSGMTEGAVDKAGEVSSSTTQSDGSTSS